MKKYLDIIKSFFTAKGLTKSGFAIGTVAAFILGMSTLASYLLVAFIAANFDWVVDKVTALIKKIKDKNNTEEEK